MPSVLVQKPVLIVYNDFGQDQVADMLSLQNQGDSQEQKNACEDTFHTLQRQVVVFLGGQFGPFPLELSEGAYDSPASVPRLDDIVYIALLRSLVRV